MFNPWLSFGLKAWEIGLEAHSVIALRMLRMAAGGASAEAEFGLKAWPDAGQFINRRAHGVTGSAPN